MCELQRRGAEAPLRCAGIHQLNANRDKARIRMPVVVVDRHDRPAQRQGRCGRESVFTTYVSAPGARSPPRVKEVLLRRVAYGAERADAAFDIGNLD